mgnify:CR=1 FL=1
MSFIREEYKLVPEGEYLVTEVKGKKIGFRKWTWGEKNQVTTECTHMDPLSGFMSFDSKAFHEQLFLKTVYKFIDEKFVAFTLEEILALDGKMGDRLFQITQQLNLVQAVETQNL